MRWLTLVALVACGRPVPPTVADGCYNLAVAVCERHATCGTLKGTLGDCRANEVAACCQGAQCAIPVTACKDSEAKTCCGDAACSPQAINVTLFDKCEAGIRALTCGQLAAALTPTACVN
jgi:hypothetical protein